MFSDAGNLSVPSLHGSKLQLQPQIAIARFPSPRKEISYLDGSLTISNEVEDEEIEFKNDYSDSEEYLGSEIQQFAAETDSILTVLCTADKESTNAQLCLGNLRVCLGFRILLIY